MSSKSWPEDLRSWTATRLLRPRIGVLWLLVTACMLAAAPAHLASSALLAAVLIAQFRLWDDLADRAYDARHHGPRVLTASVHGARFGWLCAGAALPVLALLWSWSDPVRLGAYLLLCAAMAGLYLASPPRLLRAPLVLLKYPFFVWLAAPNLSLHAALALWGALAAYELLTHATPDPLHDHPGTPTMNLADMPTSDAFEACACYLCGAAAADALVTGQDDLTGKPGRFSFVQCRECGMAYQSPRLTLDWVKHYYDDEYIAHRKKTDWGWLTPFYQRAMRKHDLGKLAMVDRAVRLSPGQRVLDIGCGAGTFLLELVTRDKVAATGVDFKDLSHLPAVQQVDFRCGLLADQDLAPGSFSLITMWHFLEHDYDPNATLARCRDLLAEDGRLVIEVPRLDSLSFKLYRERWPGLQAPQHTVLYSRASLLAMAKKQGLVVEEYLPWGAFPAYFYLFAGFAFKLLRGRGLNLDKAILPYFLGQVLLAPVLLFERRLNLAMQTIICRRAP